MRLIECPGCHRTVEVRRGLIKSRLGDIVTRLCSRRPSSIPSVKW